MKRYSIIILYLISASLLCAAPADKPTVPDETVTIKVTGGVSDQKFIGAGFSSNSVDDWVATPGGFTSTSEALTPMYTENDDVIAVYNLPLFVYWKLLTNHSIDLIMSIPAALSNSKATIDWNVSWTTKAAENGKGNVRQVDIDSNADNQIPSSKTIKSFKSDNKLETLVGSIPLTIQTGSLFGKDLTASYTGTLQLKMVVK